MMNYHFFAVLSRMKYIERWALMRSSRPENLSEHSLETAMIAHALCLIGNVRYGKDLDCEKAALIGMYHDASEIITGDMPTPVKYYSDEIRSAYRQVEAIAENRLLDHLPDDLRPYYHEILKNDDEQLYRYVKAADKLSALIKCIEERSAGSTEFKEAYKSTLASLEKMKADVPEIEDFMKDFLDGYGKTLDELLTK
ncbi:MAG: 5'-deoxynucleotidase [Solobacterium sp.]|nr:5'-deoxynucleotidase [Solobacterium sp.]